MKKLILLTLSYPYGKGEEFIEAEIPILAKEFDITIIPLQSSPDCRQLPANVTVAEAVMDVLGNVKKSEILFKAKWLLLRYLFNFLPHFLNRTTLKATFFSMTEALRWKECIAKAYAKDSNKPTIIYSYWMSRSALGAIFFKQSIKDKISIIARVHGFDLFIERHPFNYIPFQKEIVKKLNYIFPACQAGTDYLKTLFPEYSKKISTKYLGVTKSPNVFKPITRSKPMHIVSCSHLATLKRVDFIIKALGNLPTEIQQNIKWTHIGDGIERQTLETLAKEQLTNLNKWTFEGHKQNSEILELYDKTPPACLITTTSTEGGCPVSIQEAMSRGIPAIGTAVGGIPEIIEDGKTGFILTETPTIESVTEAIHKLYSLSDKDYSDMSSNAYKTWQTQFNAEKNHSQFTKQLLDIQVNK